MKGKRRCRVVEEESRKEPYNIIEQGGSGEVEEKKSRFIANVSPVETEEEALSYIEMMKKKYCLHRFR